MGRLKFPEFLLPLFGRFKFRILCSAPYKGLIKDSLSKTIHTISKIELTHISITA
jgi:hypothetical protein